MEENVDGNSPPGHHKYSPLEEECIDLIESISDSDEDIEDEKKIFEHKLWTTFQNTAMAITQLYRENPNPHHSPNHWNTFQSASTNAALLYKECSDFQKKMNDFHFQKGYNKRNKELMSWAKMKKNHIRRDELLAFISGRPYSPGHVSGIYKFNRSRASSRSTGRFYPVDSNSLDIRTTSNDDTNLSTFREALVNFRNASSVYPNNNNNNNNNNHKRSPPRHVGDDLNEFISQEYHRHVESRKRSPNMDVCMDSPTNKRARLA